MPTFRCCFLTISSSVSSSISVLVTVSSTSPKIMLRCWSYAWKENKDRNIARKIKLESIMVSAIACIIGFGVDGNSHQQGSNSREVSPWVLYSHDTLRKLARQSTAGSSPVVPPFLIWNSCKSITIINQRVLSNRKRETPLEQLKLLCFDGGPKSGEHYWRHSERLFRCWIKLFLYFNPEHSWMNSPIKIIPLLSKVKGRFPLPHDRKTPTWKNRATLEIIGFCGVLRKLVSVSTVRFQIQPMHFFEHF